MALGGVRIPPGERYSTSCYVRELAGLPAGDGRGCSVGRTAPSSTRLPLHGVLTTKKDSISYGKQAELLYMADLLL